MVAWSLGSSACAEDLAYPYGPAPIDCQSDQYQLHSLTAYFPIEVRFLIGQRGDEVQFLAGRVGQVSTPASNGQLAIHRSSFNLLMKKPESYRVEGTLEVFSQRDFCAAIESGIFLSIAAGTDPIATLKLTADGSGLHGDDAVFGLTVDRIGRRYYDTFRFFLASSLDWLPVWKKSNSKAPFSTEHDWAKYYAEHRCSHDKSWGSYKYIEEPACSYLGNVTALEALLNFIEATGLYHQSKFPDRESFRLSSIPATAIVTDPEFATYCLSLTAKVGGAPVNFCPDTDDYLHIADVRDISYRDNLGMENHRQVVSGDFGVPRP